MALKLSIVDTRFGNSVAEAYAKIGKINGTKDSLSYDVEIFVSADARQNKKAPIEIKRFIVKPLDLSGALLPALYEDLKTHAEFQNSVDC